MRRRGRKPGSMFPIVRSEVIRGRHYRRTVEAGTPVRCLRCGNEFLIDRDTVFYFDHELDDMPQVECPECRYSCAVIAYYKQMKF